MNIAKSAIASVIKPSCKYLRRVGNKMSFWKPKTFDLLFYIKE